jgi:hypothetical protein
MPPIKSNPRKLAQAEVTINHVCFFSALCMMRATDGWIGVARRTVMP